MRVDLLDYALPPELIAQHPTPEREAARLMVLPAKGPLAHRTIKDLAEHVSPGTLVVVNDTKVMPARILGVKEGSGGKTEIFLVRRLADAPDGAERWRALGRASKGLKPGTRIVKDDLLVELEGKGDDGIFEVRLTARSGASIEDARTRAGQMPLPPYIKREVSAADEHRYQTVYARAPGAVAAPTAGLHLTPALMKRLEARDCEIATCTLHVGLGTFQPVTVDDLDQHAMHAEYFEVTRALAASIARARARGAPVLAVGTTVVRALESAFDPEREGHVRPCAEETRILIQPGYRFQVVDRLLTNFHLPKSTLLALVSAFGGRERMLDAYATAVRERYRFFSYGDAMLVDRTS
ncbi:MAG: tRNA preQ1(34) S-adenosylmethionine ribosyltransferase-isomerase QueA [Deltaproteobacteria bacterium]|nr:tRNA preQ1(34) S-adenosylmethionine ribosyltransferase-isomerase QueA [Deltaproteobacteria bacterium]